MTVACTSCVPGSTGVAALALSDMARSYMGIGGSAEPSTIRVTRPSERVGLGRQSLGLRARVRYGGAQRAPVDRVMPRLVERRARALVRTGRDGRVDYRPCARELPNERLYRVVGEVAVDLTGLVLARHHGDILRLQVSLGDPARLRAAITSAIFALFASSAAFAEAPSVWTPNEKVA